MNKKGHLLQDSFNIKLSNKIFYKNKIVFDQIH
jgi:hypothetical protein